MPKTFEEFIQEWGKPKTLKEKTICLAKTAKKKVMDGVKWVVDNPQEAAVLGTLATGAGAVLKRIAKSVDRNVTARREKYNKERYVYDHSANRWLKTSKVLTKKDVERIEELRRKNPGMKMTEAMAKLKLLK